MNNDSNPIIVALEIGTSKVVAMIAEILPDGQYKIIGIGEEIARGMKKGVINNIDFITQTVQKAFQAAEQMARRKIQNVYVGIGGCHIQSYISHGLAPIKNNEVTEHEIENVMETARAIKLPIDQQLLHSVPQGYSVDSQDSIREPLGLSGVRLAVSAYNVSGAKTVIQNIAKCVRRTGFEISGLILQPLAAADVILTNDEKELGVMLIDMGAGTMDVAIFADGVIQYVGIFPLGGEFITKDIARGLTTSIVEAEELKVQYGVAREEIADPKVVIRFPGYGDRKVKEIAQQNLASMIEPRVRELFEHAQQLVQKTDCAERYSSVVLTGGITALPGIVDVVEEVLQKRVRIGVPQYDGNLADVVAHPRFSASLGILNAAKDAYLHEQSEQKPTLKKIFKGIKSWFIGNF